MNYIGLERHSNNIDSFLNFAIVFTLQTKKAKMPTFKLDSQTASDDP
ncbi:hypothetical protein [Vibrio xiamenensis]|nr:hypothetical protein [Vibrio xiamenensis]